MSAPRHTYACKAISQIPRLLGNQDRNPFSPTYGCFHTHAVQRIVAKYARRADLEDVSPTPTVTEIPAATSTPTATGTPTATPTATLIPQRVYLPLVLRGG